MAFGTSRGGEQSRFIAISSAALLDLRQTKKIQEIESVNQIESRVKSCKSLDVITIYSISIFCEQDLFTALLSNHQMDFRFNTDETSAEFASVFLMETGRCDNGCIWNSDVHSYKTESSEREYELEKVLDVKTCWKCYKWSPESLQALCRSKIVRSEKLVKMACLVLPSSIIPPLMQQAVLRLDALCVDDWQMKSVIRDFQLESVIRILIEHWPFRVLDVSTLTRRKYSAKLVRKLAVDRFLETISSGNLMNELVASDCEDLISFFETMIFYQGMWEFSSFLEYIRKRTEEAVISKENLERKYIVRTNVMVRSAEQVAEYVQNLRFFQRKNSPFDVRIEQIICSELNMPDMLELFSVIDPKYVESVCLTYRYLNVKDIPDLEAILREFQSLSTLYLDVGYVNRIFNSYDISDTISALLDPHLQTITRLHLKSLHPCRHLERLRLPMFLTELRIRSAEMTVDHFEQFANLYHFPVLTRFSLAGFYVCEGLVKFIGNHAPTLTKLELIHSMDNPTSHMKALADHLRRFGILQDFTYSFGFGCENYSEILLEFVENFLGIENITHLHVTAQSPFKNPRFREMMKDLIDRISAERKNPFDFCCIEYR